MIVRQLIRYLARASWPQLLIGGIAAIVSGVAGVMFLVIINLRLSSTDNDQRELGLIYLMLVAVGMGARYLSSTWVSKAMANVTWQLRDRFVHDILSAPLRSIEHQGPARILGAITYDISTISSASTATSELAINLVLSLGCFAHLVQLSPRGALLTGALSLVAAGFIVVASRQGRSGLIHLRAARERVLQSSRTLIEGFKELTLSAPRRQGFLAQTFIPDSQSLRGTTQKVELHRLATSGGVTWLMYGALTILLFAPAQWVDLGTTILVKFVLTLTLLFTALERVRSALQVIQQAVVAMQKLEAISGQLDKEQAPQEVAPIVWKPGSQVVDSLLMEGISMRYASGDVEDPFMLGPVDFRLRKGELVFITGGNGSGKTTFAKILCGLYMPDAGTIKLNGRVVTSEEIEDYRSHFSAVFQDCHLFSDLLGIASPQLADQAAQALQRFKMETTVQLQDGHFSNLRLSTGQRKRLALMVARLENRPVLVLDEWAAEQDFTFREFFYTELLPELKAEQRTIVVVSHDDRYFSHADRLFQLESGREVRDQTGYLRTQPIKKLEAL